MTYTSQIETPFSKKLLFLCVASLKEGHAMHFPRLAEAFPSRPFLPVQVALNISLIQDQFEAVVWEMFHNIETKQSDIEYYLKLQSCIKIACTQQDSIIKRVLLSMELKN